MLNLNFVSIPTHLSRKWWAQKIDILFALGILLQGGAVWAVEIINVSGPPELFKVQRGTSVLDAALYFPLEKDDEVFVLKPEPITQKLIDSVYGGKAYLTLKLDDGEIKELGPEERFKVPSVPSLPPFEGWKKWLTFLWREHDEKERNVAKGSLELAMPLPLLGTDSDPAKLVAGKSSLHLVLAKKDQSQPSYWVHVYEDNVPLTPKGFVVEQPEIVFPSKEAGLPSLSLSSVGKKYKVVVIGKDGSVRKGVFEIEKDLKTSVLLVHKELEELNAITADKSRNDEEKETLIATLLAQNGLLLEAYQKVANSSPGSGIPFFLKSFLIDEQLRERVWREQAMKMEEEMMKMKGRTDNK